MVRGHHDRYSFGVELLHLLLNAGLSRRISPRNPGQFARLLARESVVQLFERAIRLSRYPPTDDTTSSGWKTNLHLIPRDLILPRAFRDYAQPRQQAIDLGLIPHR